MYFSRAPAVDRVQLSRLAIYIISFDKLVNTIVGTALGQMLLLVLREQGVETVNIAVHVRCLLCCLLVCSCPFSAQRIALKSCHICLESPKLLVRVSKKSQRLSGDRVGCEGR